MLGIGPKCTCKPGDHHCLSGAADRERSAVLHRYEMSTSLKKQKSQLFLGIHWQPIPVSAGRGSGHRAPVELCDCGVGGHRCQH